MPPFRVSDLPFRARLTYAAHAFKAIAKQHHKEMLPLLRRLLEPDMVVFDVGGHSGQFAKLFARLVPRGRVYSFEPSGYALSILRRAVAWNRLDNVTTLRMGLGDAPGELTLETPVKAHGGRRFGLAHFGPGGDGRRRVGETVPVGTIDGVVADRGLTRLDLIKMDIEGWELRALTGGRVSIARFRPIILVELEESHLARAEDTLESAWATLTAWGYRPFVWLGGEDLEPLAQPRNGDAVWLPESHPLAE
ncbi:MAG: FkbM family methyltransferase [Rhodobacterales bacterium]|nr:FkbM family methyltransferase [Rhodobacterales bacterium]